MIKRKMQSKLLSLSRQYNVVTITGPRQSGKTTLAKLCFPKYGYVSLEDLDTREFAKADPRGFLTQAKNLIIDEVQKVPELVSYIQGVVDKEDRPGQFILTGSHQFKLSSIVSQSLAGRTAILKLLPFSMSELGNEPLSYQELLYRGFYPKIIDKNLNPTEASSFYVETYLQKDLREIKEIKNLRQFEKFLKICASNIGQLLNKARIANDIGVDGKTVASWISVLEASYVIYLLQPHSANFRKRLVKMPKLYFCDVGLASYLLGIKNKSHIESHPLKGLLFENLVVIEKLKSAYNKAEDPGLYFFRDNIGNEVDLLKEDGLEIISYEIKSTKTLNIKLFKGLEYYKNLNPNNKKSNLIYSGEEIKEMYSHQCIPYNKIK